jgi:catechol-2,3-dioxygenase
MVEMTNVNPAPGTRSRVPTNPHGLTGMDHVALPARDPGRAARFYEQVLGGTLYYATGYSDQDKDLGRVPHIFVHVGDVLIQVAYPSDGESFPDPDNPSLWPHWAFAASPGVLDAMCERLREHDVPFSGPHSHLNVEAVSIYFMDTEGNKLEICTWEPYPAEETTMLGGPGGATLDYPSLAHRWRPHDGR